MHVRRRINQSGDTIVEVLIAIAVSSAVLGSSYAIVSRTIKSQQQTSEHTDALNLAESQLELLRQRVKAGGTTSSDFCFRPTGTYQSPSSAACKLAAPNDRYQPRITKSGDTFKIAVSWDGTHGGTDNIELLYKAY